MVEIENGNSSGTRGLGWPRLLEKFTLSGILEEDRNMATGNQQVRCTIVVVIRANCTEAAFVGRQPNCLRYVCECGVTIVTPHSVRAGVRNPGSVLIHWLYRNISGKTDIPGILANVKINISVVIVVDECESRVESVASGFRSFLDPGSLGRILEGSIFFVM